MRKKHPFTSSPPVYKRQVVCLPEEVEANMKRFESQGLHLEDKRRVKNVDRGDPGFRLIFTSNKNIKEWTK